MKNANDRLENATRIMFNSGFWDGIHAAETGAVADGKAPKGITDGLAGRHFCQAYGTGVQYGFGLISRGEAKPNSSTDEWLQALVWEDVEMLNVDFIDEHEWGHLLT